MDERERQEHLDKRLKLLRRDQQEQQEKKDEERVRQEKIERGSMILQAIFKAFGEFFLRFMNLVWRTALVVVLLRWWGVIE